MKKPGLCRAFAFAVVLAATTLNSFLGRNRSGGLDDGRAFGALVIISNTVLRFPEQFPFFLRSVVGLRLGSSEGAGAGSLP
jgi:hypothetical protein